MFLEHARGALQTARGEGKVYIEKHIAKVLPMSEKQFAAYESELRKLTRRVKTPADLEAFKHATRALADSK